jgi:hypothetical protein
MRKSFLGSCTELDFSYGFQAIQVVGDAWLLSQGGRNTFGLNYPSNTYRLVKGKDSWEEITNGLKQSYITAFAAVGDTVYAGTSSTIQSDTLVASELFKLEHALGGDTWEPLRAGG